MSYPLVYILQRHLKSGGWRWLVRNGELLEAVIVQSSLMKMVSRSFVIRLTFRAILQAVIVFRMTPIFTQKYDRCEGRAPTHFPS